LRFEIDIDHDIGNEQSYLNLVFHDNMGRSCKSSFLIEEDNQFQLISLIQYSVNKSISEYEERLIKENDDAPQKRKI
jgi:hypothetical protein